MGVIMNDGLTKAFQILTGETSVPPTLSAGLGDINDPIEIRKRILASPALYSLLPELRLAYEIRAIRRAKAAGEIRLVVGAAGTSFEGWVSTNSDLLDLCKPNQWLAWFEPGSVNAILAEHVWEHLDANEGQIACDTCFRFLAPGGRLRLAVPDAYHPDPAYREISRIGGPHAHKMFYDYQSLPKVMRWSGFEVQLLEYWDEGHEFHETAWDPKDGHIGRCRKFDHRNRDGGLRFTSLIVDGVKPCTGVA